jgi:lipopolysaccharide/colanic/teichoic acid biosynthesis glycosyltransferase
MQERLIYSREHIDVILRYERARADRAECGFCLVVFQAEPGRLQRLTRAVLSRSRSTDAVGRFDDRSICAILPGTSAAGAGRFAGDVVGALAGGQPGLAWRIYCYPWNEAEESSGATAPAALDDLAAAPGEIIDLAPVHPLAFLLVDPLPAWKRALDIACAVFGLLITAPLMAVIAVAIKLTSHGPVLFRQVRAGIGGMPFEIYKFRTMIVDAEARKRELMSLNEQDGPAFKIRNDPRVTRIGRLLRQTSLDELPQLWNVLKGEMSLVGPRPPDVAETRSYAQWHRQRLDVTPGLTCIWQTRGRAAVSFDEWVRMDVTYIRGRSVVQDLKLILRTIPVVIFRRGGH